MRVEDVGAVVLTGGGAARLGGADKATIEVGGRTLLEHALTALAELAEIVVVGPEVPTSRPVTFTREDPPGGGPAAALLAGLRCFARRPRWVVALAVDMPLVSPATVHRLMAAARDDGAALVDEAGRPQYLCAAYALPALERIRPPDGSEAGMSMRSLVADLHLHEVPAEEAETRDLDTWEDLAELRETLAEQQSESPESQAGLE